MRIVAGVAVDLDALTEAVTEPPEQVFGRFGVRCKTCRLLLELPSGDPRSDTIRGYVLGGTEASKVVERLNRGGIDIGVDSVLRHRRRSCRTWQQVEARG